jgi:hypothetical protein
MNRYLAILIAALTSAEMQAFQLAPRIVVNITVDELRSDYIESFSPMFSSEGLRKLIEQGKVYEIASYPSNPIDRASAIATLATGATPFYHGIVAEQWLDRQTLRPVYCVDDEKRQTTANRLLTSTLGDELKISSQGKAVVYGIAATRDAAILSAGHAADNAFWIDERLHKWMSSPFYSNKRPAWLGNSEVVTNNETIVEKALDAFKASAMGADEVTDMLNVTLSAGISNKNVSNLKVEMQNIYLQLDQSIAKLVSSIEQKVGKNRVLFVLTSTGTHSDEVVDYQQYRVPTGIFYINRTASLLNVYLSAIYGQGTYIEACHKNQMFINHKLIEQKRLSLHDVLLRCQELLFQSAGVGDVYTSERLLTSGKDVEKLRAGFKSTLCGDIIIEVAPGWKLYNEKSNEQYTSRLGVASFPIIFYGNSIKPSRVTLPVTVDRIVPTVAKAIHIRAPNGCNSETLDIER